MAKRIRVLTPEQKLHKRQYERQRVAKNRDYIRAQRRAYADSIKDRLIAERKESYAKNREKRKAESNAWRLANRESVLAKKREYREQNAEKCRSAIKEHYERNREAYVAKANEWNKQNSKRRREIVQKYGDANRGALNAKGVAWKRANPDRCITHKHARRSRELQAEGFHTTEEWQTIVAKHGSKCHWCGTKAAKLARDHYLPLTKGGTNWASNIVPSCKSCNSKKHDRDPVEFARSLGRLL